MAGNANSGRRSLAQEWAHHEAAIISYQDFLKRREYIVKKIELLGEEKFLEDENNRWAYNQMIAFQHQLLLKKIPNKQEIGGHDGEPISISWMP